MATLSVPRDSVLDKVLDSNLPGSDAPVSGKQERNGQDRNGHDKSKAANKTDDSKPRSKRAIYYSRNRNHVRKDEERRRDD